MENLNALPPAFDHQPALPHGAIEIDLGNLGLDSSMNLSQPYAQTQQFDDEALMMFLAEQKETFSQNQEELEARRQDLQQERESLRKSRGHIYEFLYIHKDELLDQVEERSHKDMRKDIADFLKLSKERCSEAALNEAYRTYAFLFRALSISPREH